MTKSLADFATVKHPMHPSGLRNSIECPTRAALQFLAPIADEGGQAGDTGSAMHKAAAAWHKGASIADALLAMGTATAEYPNADFADASAMFLAYVRDDRNVKAKFPRTPAGELAIEHQIAFQIQPAKSDPTGQPISIIGRLDQVREVDGRLKMHDIKTSKKKPYVLLRSSTMQVAAYCIGASVLLGRRVEPGALICPRQYASNSQAFWHFPWTYDDCEHILEGVRHAVARIRAGDLYHLPGDNCEWCVQKSPDLCLPKLKELKLRGKS